jgi:hypothetical protein
VSTGARVFAGAAVFSFVVAIVYWFVTYEPAGTTLLVAMGLATSALAAYAAHRARRSASAEDRRDATPEDGAEEVLVVPTATAVPVLLAGSLALAGAGVVFGSAVLGLGLICALLCLIVLIRHSG